MFRCPRCEFMIYDDDAEMCGSCGIFFGWHESQKEYAYQYPKTFQEFMKEKLAVLKNRLKF